MSRQIVNTGGQGLAASDALKMAIGSAVAAIVVLLIFYFLDHAGGHTSAFATLTAVR